VRHNEVADTLQDDTARREHLTYMYMGSRAVQVSVDGWSTGAREIRRSAVFDFVIGPGAP